MGLLDDAASVISARTSHSKRSKSHRSSRSHHKERSRSKSRSRSRSRHRSSRSTVGGGGGISGMAASFFGGGGDDDGDTGNDRHHHQRRSSRHRHSHSRRDKSDDDNDGARSFFNLPNPSRSSFFSNFGLGGGGGSSNHGPSYYRRSSRPGFTSRLLKKLKRLLRDLVYYAKRHPAKVFMLVLMPLITGGALTALLARFGLRLPPFLERMLGMAAKAGAGGSMAGGLVGEAVRMVSGATSSGGGASGARATVERGREGGVQWERRSLEKDFMGGGGGGGGWADGLKGLAKMFS
ncbi:hypothetical protein C8A00DRAFT_37143 [Chaetomidium leptoderma]|uniref:Uncharacterized protein n=1 Tax=Chaetomidium leptoderma TaxID=669021 RepID=A0AAN6VFT0_9PEZI|nr:hypothetical protein C8A00DRAFT_37143 [Chaetomidium leptoderma]